jgi:ABC-2 type transport system permease protein
MTTTLPNAGLLRSTITLAGRTLTKFIRTPQVIMGTLVNGIIFVLIFRYVFGGAITTGQETYVNLLVPAIMLVSVMYAASQISVGVAEEKKEGFFDRLKSLPIPRAAPLLARVLAMTALLILSLAVNLGVGFAVGFRPDWTLVGALAAAGLSVLFAFALAWLFMGLGLLAKNAQAAQSYAILVTPLAFVSGAFIPTDSMPSWLEVVAKHQPFTVIVEAVRGLVLSDYSEAANPYVALAWLAGIVTLCIPFAVRQYARS